MTNSGIWGITDNYEDLKFQEDEWNYWKLILKFFYLVALSKSFCFLPNYISVSGENERGRWIILNRGEISGIKY